MTANVVIREMESSDIPAACALIGQLTGRELSAEDMDNRLAWVNHSPIDWLFICEVDGQVQGLLGFRLRERMEHMSRYGEVYLIVIHAEARCRGIGRALMAFAEQFAQEKDCIGTWLTSGFGRQDEAHRFYAELGYEITGYRFVKLFEN